MNIRHLIAAATLAAGVSAQVEVTSTGVGIGTTAPGRKLEVNHDLGVTSGEKIVANFTQFTGMNGLYVGYRANGSAVTSALVRADNNLAITFGTSANNEAVTITNAGRIGVGTPAPQDSLHVLGRLRSETASYPGLYLVNGGVELAAIYADTANSILNIGDMYGAAPSLALGLYTADVERLRITPGGDVGIGVISPTHKLQVGGTVRATSFISNTTTYADFVFKPDYQLPALSEVEAHIQEHGHLPGIPSEAETRAQGIDLAAMQVKLLQKIEELTLHQIAQEKRIQRLEEENTRLKILR